MPVGNCALKGLKYHLAGRFSQERRQEYWKLKVDDLVLSQRCFKRNRWGLSVKKNTGLSKSKVTQGGRETACPLETLARRQVLIVRKPLPQRQVGQVVDIIPQAPRR